MAQVQGCHLVGSVPFDDAETVFRKCAEAMPGRLRRIPDGETGARHYFVLFQAQKFAVYPPMMTQFAPNSALGTQEITQSQIDEGVETLRRAGIETGYDDAAIESYAVFRKLRSEGVIPDGVRFMVCLPTTPNVLSVFVQPAFRPAVEPLYEEALFRAMRRIQDAIPHQDLAIQIDLAVDTIIWERASTNTPEPSLEWFQPWWPGDVKQYSIDYTTRMISQIDQDVEVGIHNCYGDMEHKHIYEPTSLAAVVERGVRIMEASPRPLAFFHCPVPKSAVDNLEEYLAPLKELQPLIEKQGTELYLGVVHEGQLEMTRKMIEAAKTVASSFGVSTECGGGRMKSEDFIDAMNISTEVSTPVHTIPVVKHHEPSIETVLDKAAVEVEIIPLTDDVHVD